MPRDRHMPAPFSYQTQYIIINLINSRLAVTTCSPTTVATDPDVSSVGYFTAPAFTGPVLEVVHSRYNNTREIGGGC